MRSCKIFPLTSYEVAIQNLNEILTPQQRSKQWCFKNNRHAYYMFVYDKTIDYTMFNRFIYEQLMVNGCQGYNDLKVCTIENFNKCNAYLPIYSYYTWYAVQIYDNNIHTNTCIIGISDTGHLHCTYNAYNTFETWDSNIPEIYKDQIKFIKTEPYTGDQFITNQNISINDNALYVNHKPCNDYGYYTNIDDMFVIKHRYIELHIPFNIIDLNNPYIKKCLALNNNAKYVIINDNQQLQNRCDTTVIAIDNCMIDNIVNKQNLTIISKQMRIKYPHLLFRYTEQI